MNDNLKWLAENVHEWPESYSDLGRLLDSITECYAAAWDGRQWGSINGFTRAQWQAARDEIGLNHSVEPTEKVWRGPEDGLPPVNSIVEYTSAPGEWIRVRILGHHPTGNDVIWHESIDTKYSDGTSYSVDSLFLFRPIRSEEDEAVEDMVKISMETPMIASLDYIETAHRDACRALYRAGYRKQEDK